MTGGLDAPKGRCRAHHVLPERPHHPIWTGPVAYDVGESCAHQPSSCTCRDRSVPNMKPMINPTAGMAVSKGPSKTFKELLTYIHPSWHPFSLHAVSHHAACRTLRRRTFVKGRGPLRAARNTTHRDRHGSGVGQCCKVKRRGGRNNAEKREVEQPSQAARLAARQEMRWALCHVRKDAHQILECASNGCRSVSMLHSSETPRPI